MAPGAASAKGSSASAARPFCQKAMSVADRVPDQRRFITTSSANVNPETSPQPRPRTTGFASESSGTSSTRPAVTSSAVTPSRRRSRRAKKTRSASEREQRKAGVAEQADGHGRHLDRREEAEPVERQHDAVADEAHVERRALAGCAAAGCRAPAAAIAVRPSTMATGDSASHLPKRPAKPKSATATCSATSAAACVMRCGPRQRTRHAPAGLCHQRRMLAARRLR